jgi:NADP-dependent 3-hydroxy acid dehydrogenase YdfG
MEPADVAVSIVHAVRQPAQAGLNEPVIRPSD